VLDAAGNLQRNSLFSGGFYLFFNLGNVYIVDHGNQRIRKVTVSTGIITTIAGSGGTGSYSGDNGPATSAKLYNPHVVTLDTAGAYSFVLHSLSFDSFPYSPR
jgi:hypothetical protein